MTMILSDYTPYLRGLEETIISDLIKRAQHKVNSIIYEPGKSSFKEHDDKSLFQVRLLEQERMDSRFGRFTVPEERPYNVDLPPVEGDIERTHRYLLLEEINGDLKVDPTNYLLLQHINVVNLVQEIMQAYLSLVPVIYEEGDDHNNYGSSVEEDVAALRSISERIHYGALFVAECKFQGDPVKYSRLIADKDEDGLETALTRSEIETDTKVRVKRKVDQLQATADPRVRKVINPEDIERFYEGCVIPLTKKGEVAYLLQRPIEISAA